MATLQARETRDPVERYGILSLKLLVYVWLSYFFYQAVITFTGYVPGQPWPFMLSTFRMFTFLPIHEAGHLIFGLFGRTLNILGGSFWQIVFPLLWFVIAARQRSHVAPFAAFWVGENSMDVSLYIRDAPVRALPLLGGHASRHDWYNLLTDWNMLDSSEILADTTYYLGVLICLAAIAAGVFLSVRSFFLPPLVATPAPTEPSGPSGLEGTLDELIRKKE